MNSGDRKGLLVSVCRDGFTVLCVNQWTSCVICVLFSDVTLDHLNQTSYPQKIKDD